MIAVGRQRFGRREHGALMVSEERLTIDRSSLHVRPHRLLCTRSTGTHWLYRQSSAARAVVPEAWH
jgi:hypothetical protein